MHEQERRAGSIVIEIHCDGEGTPKKAWVQARVEVALQQTTLASERTPDTTR
jgi:hypothetical protein